MRKHPPRLPNVVAGFPACLSNLSGGSPPLSSRQRGKMGLRVWPGNETEIVLLFGLKMLKHSLLSAAMKIL